jgi:hypothetical protein
MTQGKNATDKLYQGAGKESRAQWIGFETIPDKKPLYWMKLLEEVICFRMENCAARGEVWLTEAEFEKFLDMPSEERVWRDALLKSLAEEKLLTHPKHLMRNEILEFISMERDEQSQWRDRLSKRKSTPTQEAVTGNDSGKVTNVTPDHTRARVRVRKSYVNPAREDKIMVGVHVAPELKDALKKKFEQSGFDNFNEFLATGLQSLVQEPSQGLKPDAELLATALTQTRSLEKTISLLSRNVFTRLSSDSTPSR